VGATLAAESEQRLCCASRRKRTHGSAGIAKPDDALAAAIEVESSDSTRLSGRLCCDFNHLVFIAPQTKPAEVGLAKDPSFCAIVRWR
jgi:hypothetical protein